MKVLWSEEVSAFKGMRAAWSKGSPDPQQEVVGCSPLQSRECHRISCSESFASQAALSKSLPAFLQFIPLQLLSLTQQWLPCSRALSDGSLAVSSSVLASLSRSRHSLVVSACVTVGINTKFNVTPEGPILLPAFIKVTRVLPLSLIGSLYVPVLCVVFVISHQPDFSFCVSLLIAQPGFH